MNLALLLLIASAHAEPDWTRVTRDLPAAVTPAAGPIPAERAALREATELITQQYVDPIDPDTLANASNMGDLLAKLDEYSSYQDASSYERLWQRRRFGHMPGVGVIFEHEKKPGEPLIVAYPLAGSPADAAGLAPGDRILKVGTIDLVPLAFDEAVAAFQGERGTIAELEVEGKGRIDVTRERIRPDTFTSLILPGEPKTGYLRFSEFTLKTSGRTAKALEKLREKGMSSLILDLRRNTGGEVEAAVLIAGLFLPEGSVVVRLRGRGGEQILRTDFAGPFRDLPVTVLTDHGTLSASEILAGALQDHRRATTVGSRTGGKGSMQMTHVLTNGGAFNLTTHRWYTPLGRSIAKTPADPGGIEPDLPVTADKAVQMNAILDLMRSAAPGGRPLTDLPNDPVLRGALSR